MNTGRIGLLAASAILAVAACGAGHPWWFTSGRSNCAAPISIRVHGSVQDLGGCAGGLSGTPETIRLRTGDHLDLHVLRIADGALSVPVPIPDQPAVLQMVERDSDGSTVTYKAEGIGDTSISTDTDCAGAVTEDGGQHTCQVLRVIVAQSS